MSFFRNRITGNVGICVGPLVPSTWGIWCHKKITTEMYTFDATNILIINLYGEDVSLCKLKLNKFNQILCILITISKGFGEITFLYLFYYHLFPYSTIVSYVMCYVCFSGDLYPCYALEIRQVHLGIPPWNKFTSQSIGCWTVAGEH